MIRLLIFCLFLSSCGYHLGNKQRDLPGGYKKLAVPVFVNETAEVGIEAFFTSALIEEISRSPDIEVTSRDQAEVILEGWILNLSKVPRGELDASRGNALPDNTGLARQYVLRIKTHLQLRRKADQKILWQNDLLSSVAYQAAQIGAQTLNTANPIYNQSAQLINSQNLAKTMMAEAFNQMLQKF